jgi:hypothetical protein
MAAKMMVLMLLTGTLLTAAVAPGAMSRYEYRGKNRTLPSAAPRRRNRFQRRQMSPRRRTLQP